MILSGQSPDGRLVEIVELRGPPLVRGLPVPPGVQIRPDRPHPLFRGFVRAAMAGSGKPAAIGVIPDDTTAARQPVQVVAVEPAR